MQERRRLEVDKHWSQRLQEATASRSTGCEPARSSLPAAPGRARRLIASSGMGVWPEGTCCRVHRCAQAGSALRVTRGEPPVDRGTARDPAARRQPLPRRLPLGPRAQAPPKATGPLPADRAGGRAPPLRRDTWSALAAAGLDSVPVNARNHSLLRPNARDHAVLLGALPPVSPVSDGAETPFTPRRGAPLELHATLE